MAKVIAERIAKETEPGRYLLEFRRGRGRWVSSNSYRSRVVAVLSMWLWWRGDFSYRIVDTEAVSE